MKQKKISLLLLGILFGIPFCFAEKHKAQMGYEHRPIIITKLKEDVFLNGDYEDYLELISLQPKEEKLSWKEFCHIQEMKEMASEVNLATLSTLSSREDLKIEDFFSKLKEDLTLFEGSFFAYLNQVANNDPAKFTKSFYQECNRIKKGVMRLKYEKVDKVVDSYKKSLAKALNLDTSLKLDQYLLNEAICKQIYSKVEIEKIKDQLLNLPANQCYEIIRGEREAEYHYLQKDQRYCLHHK